MIKTRVFWGQSLLYPGERVWFVQAEDARNVWSGLANTRAGARFVAKQLREGQLRIEDL